MKFSKALLGMAAAASLLCLASTQQPARAESSVGVSKDMLQSESLLTKVQHSRRESRRESRHEREREREKEAYARHYCKDTLAVAGRGRPFKSAARGNAIKMWRSEALLKWGQEYADFDNAKNATVQCYKIGDFGWKKCEVKAHPCRPAPSRD